VVNHLPPSSIHEAVVTKAHLRDWFKGTCGHRFGPTDRSGSQRADIRTLSIASLIGEAIGRTASEESVSSLFD
jgi:hypothetical protein